MNPGDYMIWHPLMLGDEHWTVRIERAGEIFCLVEVTPFGNRPGVRVGHYVARVEELHAVDGFVPAAHPSRIRSRMETDYATPA